MLEGRVSAVAARSPFGIRSAEVVPVVVHLVDLHVQEEWELRLLEQTRSVSHLTTVGRIFHASHSGRLPEFPNLANPGSGFD